MTREEALQIAKPILFNTEMVQAIQDGRKTATRRIVKPQPPKDSKGTYERMDNGNFQLKVAPYDTIYDYEIKPKYQVGDILYVRETWGVLGGVGDQEYIYRADDDMGTDRWHPSIHMPKEAARIFLRVTDVRVERLQEISQEQIMREGVYKSLNPIMDICNYVYESQPKKWYSSMFDCFRFGIWNSTIPKKDLDKYGWAANPWVWVIEFEKVEVQNG